MDEVAFTTATVGSLPPDAPHCRTTHWETPYHDGQVTEEEARRQEHPPRHQPDRPGVHAYARLVRARRVLRDEGRQLPRQAHEVLWRRLERRQGQGAEGGREV